MNDAQRKVDARHAELNGAAGPRPPSFLRVTAESNALGPTIAVTAQIVAGAWTMTVSRDGEVISYARVSADSAERMALAVVRALAAEVRS